MNSVVKKYIQHLDLLPHPEGGYYKETYRCATSLPANSFGINGSGERNISTAIYFLLEAGNFSAFHRIKSDELWHFYTGDALEVIEIHANGTLTITSLGSDVEQGKIFQYMVPAHTWFASRVKSGGSFSLVGCTVAPGFDFADFDLVKREDLIQTFPQHEKIIRELTRV